MKVKLLKPFLSYKTGSIITMHPLNARRYYRMEICEALTDEEQAYLEGVIVSRGKLVETGMVSRAVENATVTPERTHGLRKPRKSRASQVVGK